MDIDIAIRIGYYPANIIASGGGFPPGTFTYLRPGGVFTYLRPDGTSTYRRP